jgi:hypothetical protein
MEMKGGRWLLRLLEPRRVCECPSPPHLSDRERTHADGVVDCRYKAGLKEIQILQKIQAADLDDKRHLIRLERTFEHRGHLCLVFESMR